MTTQPLSTQSGAHDAGQLFPAGQLLPFALVTVLFFIWGMSNNLTDILVQQFRKSFELSPLEAQLVQTAVFFGYFCMALPAALAARRWGYKTSILLGLILFGTGTLMFWPAAVIGRYWLMLTALYFVGCGSATLETSANPFIAQTGPPESSARRLNFSQAFNPPGTIFGVLIGTFFIFSGVELPANRVAEMKAQGTYAAYLHGELMRVVPTYVCIGIGVLALAAIIAAVRFPGTRDEDSGMGHSVVREIFSLLSTAQVLGATVTQFFYCGAQVATWSAFIPYVKQYTSISERQAALFFLTGNLTMFFLGRVVSTAVMRWFHPSRMMALYAAINIFLVAIGVFLPGFVGAGALLLSSFFMSMMFPTIFALGVRDLGPRTKLASSLIVMSIVGAAIVPPILGLIAKHTGSYAIGYSVVAVCYVAVLIYGIRTSALSKGEV
ncbi:L-fucose:H+ symporter permease [Terracidiphilus sp.]|jgi:FHS family L-fucose permease-like MFS transporter|uniref:L-fucose:H+ symporter permease n=1 Tax=Terracidiphilus sp. TaxID=1964191 RepID=UPI003C21BCF3